MENSFKSSLSFDINDLREKKLNSLKQKHNSLKSPIYEEFTNKVLLAIGKELETVFPMLTFRLVQRFKTDYSFENKAKMKIQEAYSKNNDIQDISNLKLYDSIGYEIIIENVPDNFTTNDEKFNKALKKLLDKRISAKKDLEKEKISYKRFLNEYKDYKSSDSSFNQIFNIATQNFEKIIKNATNYYLEKNDQCELEVASYVVTYLSEHSEIMKSLGIQSVPNTKKEHNERYLAYRATHNCIEVPTSYSNFPHRGWVAELQGKSSYRHSVGEEGVECHITRFSKNRVLPELSDAKFYKSITKVVPKYKIYIKNGLAYELSPLESFIHYFRIDLQGNKALNRPSHPEYFEKIVNDKTILNDERKIIKEENNLSI